MKHYSTSERLACRLLELVRSTKRYTPRQRNDEDLRRRLHEVAAKRPRFGYRRLHELIKRQKQIVNHKRIERVYREEGLCLRRKSRKRLRREGPPSAAPTRRNQRWSMDFICNAVAGKRSFRAFTLVDDYTRECLAIEADTSIGGERVAAARGCPKALLSDNGPEFTSRVVEAWSLERGVRHEFIESGKPVQNAFIESFNGRLREECLNTSWFTSFADTRRQLEAWRGGLQPRATAQQCDCSAQKTHVRWRVPPPKVLATAIFVLSWKMPCGTLVPESVHDHEHSRQFELLGHRLRR